MKISRESLIIASIGVADLATTLIWVQHHGAKEANPLFRFYLAQGPIWFAAMKVVMLAAPIFLLEWARRHRPVFTRWASRCAIMAYLGMYGVGVMHLNPNLLRPHFGPAVVDDADMADPDPIFLCQTALNIDGPATKSPGGYDGGASVATIAIPNEY